MIKRLIPIEPTYELMGHYKVLLHYNHGWTLTIEDLEVAQSPVQVELPRYTIDFKKLLNPINLLTWLRWKILQRLYWKTLAKRLRIAEFIRTHTPLNQIPYRGDYQRLKVII